MATSAPIRRHHHITLCSGGAQEDYDFHTKVLSLKSVKKTALYDGDVPIYHLYYGNDLGEESTLVTTFPMRQSGRKARKGTGQIRSLSLSVPTTAWSASTTTIASRTPTARCRRSSRSAAPTGSWSACASTRPRTSS